MTKTVPIVKQVYRELRRLGGERIIEWWVQRLSDRYDVLEADHAQVCQMLHSAYDIIDDLQAEISRLRFKEQARRTRDVLGVEERLRHG